MPTTAGDIAMLGIRRRNFVGNTDKYLPTRAAPSSVIEGVRKEVGFLDMVNDPNIFNEIYKQTARERLEKYKERVRFYEGEHFTQPYDDGEKKPVFNFCKTVVDHSVDFFVAKGIAFKSVEGNEDVATALNLIWEANDKDGIFRKLALMSSITGDSYLYITLQDKDAAGKVLPREQWKIVLTPLDPFFVFPAFSDTDSSEMKAAIVQFPMKQDDKGGVIFKTLYLTANKYQVIVDSNVIEEGENPFGMVPLVHFPNMLDPVKTFGQSDLEAIIPVNEEYNVTVGSIRKIIKYHAEPTTVIFGARASKLEKGAKKVWSGLPTDARVENLAFTSDLKSSFEYLKLLESTIYNVGNIPGSLMGTATSMNRATGLALRMIYQPLFNKTERKKIAFNFSFKRSTKIIFKALELIGLDVKLLAENPEALYDISVAYTDPLPFDTVAELDADTKKVALGVVSVAQLLRKYNPDTDLDRLSTEILADKINEVLTQLAKAQALNGVEPNLLGLATSSIVINADIGAVIEGIRKVIPKQPEAVSPEPAPIDSNPKPKQ